MNLVFIVSILIIFLSKISTSAEHKYNQDILNECLNNLKEYCINTTNLDNPYVCAMAEILNWTEKNNFDNIYTSRYRKIIVSNLEPVITSLPFPKDFCEQLGMPIKKECISDIEDIFKKEYTQQKPNKKEIFNYALKKTSEADIRIRKKGKNCCFAIGYLTEIGRHLKFKSNDVKSPNAYCKSQAIKN